MKAIVYRRYGSPDVLKYEDVAGKIEVAGRNVTQFKQGDAVFGSCAGAYAGP